MATKVTSKQQKGHPTWIMVKDVENVNHRHTCTRWLGIAVVSFTSLGDPWRIRRAVRSRTDSTTGEETTVSTRKAIPGRYGATPCYPMTERDVSSSRIGEYVRFIPVSIRRCSTFPSSVPSGLHRSCTSGETRPSGYRGYTRRSASDCV